MQENKTANCEQKECLVNIFYTVISKKSSDKLKTGVNVRVPPVHLFLATSTFLELSKTVHTEVVN